MTLWHLVHAAGVPHGVCHVDYGLRGADSDADAQLVRSVAELREVDCHVYVNDTVRRARAGRQELARRVRYRYFRDLVRDGLYAAVATAHHADDQVETLALALLRGAGPEALAGIRARDAWRLRPLLGVSRDALRAYSLQHDVRSREDASNAEPSYLRNRVRHEVLPRLDELRPGWRAGATRLAQEQAAWIDLARAGAQEVLAQARTAGCPHASPALLRSRLAGTPGLSAVLTIWLRGEGFARGTIERIRERIESGDSSRARFESDDRKAVVVVSGRWCWLDQAAGRGS